MMERMREELVVEVVEVAREERKEKEAGETKEDDV